MVMRSSKVENLAQLRNSRNHTYDGREHVAQPVAQLAQPAAPASIATIQNAQSGGRGGEGMRKLMPATAEIIDWLREVLGREAADKIIRKGMQGKGGFWVREQCPDGQVREFGSKR